MVFTKQIIVAKYGCLMYNKNEVNFDCGFAYLQKKRFCAAYDGNCSSVSNNGNGFMSSIGTRNFWQNGYVLAFCFGKTRHLQKKLLCI